MMWLSYLSYNWKHRISNCIILLLDLISNCIGKTKFAMPPRQNSSVKMNSLSDDKKKEKIKIRNTENARRNRQRWREEDVEMVKIYEENEKRINQLEKQVVDMTKELGHISQSSRSSKPNTLKKK